MNMRAISALVFGFGSIPLEKISPVVSIAAALAAIVAAVPLIAQRFGVPVCRVVVIAVAVLSALFAVCGCALKPLKMPPYPNGAYPQMPVISEAERAASVARTAARQAATPYSYAPPTVLEVAKAKSYQTWQYAAIGFVIVAVILFCAKYPLAALCFLGGGVFSGFFGNAFTAPTVATVMLVTGVAGGALFLAWQIITRIIPRWFPSVLSPASLPAAIAAAS